MIGITRILRLRATMSGIGSRPQAMPTARHILHRRLPAGPTLVALVFGMLTALTAWRFGWPITEPTVDGGMIVDQPEMHISSGQITVSVRLTPISAERLRGWFFLAPPGEKQPWQHYSYQSAVLEREVSAGEMVMFTWTEPLAVDDGEYQLTLWFHRLQGERWVHATGGAFGLRPFVVNGANAPFRQLHGGAVANLEIVEPPSGASTPFTLLLRVTPAPTVEEATLTWELRPSGLPDAPPVYRGDSRLLVFPSGVNRAVTTRIQDSLFIAPGRYDLWLTVESGVAGGQPQRAVYRDAVQQETEPPYIRPTSPLGPYRVASIGPVPDLKPGERATLRLTVTGTGGTCQTFWRLLLPGDRIAAQGGGGPCDELAVQLPATVIPGRYRLELRAVLDGAGMIVSDLIILPVRVAER